MDKNIIVGLGEALWDMLPEGKKIGGAPANFAYHASQFGNEAYVVSAVGHDAFGDEIMETLENSGLNTEIARVDFPTGTVKVEIDSKGVPTYDICEGVAWDNIPFTPHLEELAKRTTAVCFGSLAQRFVVSHDTIHKFLAAMPCGENVLKIFDINLRQNYYSKSILAESLKECNVLKINDDELLIFNDMFGYGGLELQEKCRRIIYDFNLKIMIVTCGTKGSYVASADGTFNFEPTPKVEVVDTVGAGDSFTGAFCAAILAGKSYAEAHKLAVEVSAYVCTCSGAMPKLPEDIVNKIR